MALWRNRLRYPQRRGNRRPSNGLSNPLATGEATSINAIALEIVGVGVTAVRDQHRASDPTAPSALPEMVGTVATAGRRDTGSHGRGTVRPTPRRLLPRGPARPI
jgi:hypothetical protein